jgi:serine-type D-Ala-D-Ala carboxypeptidase/endopeptidase (penicillin-binding protein 4)
MNPIPPRICPADLPDRVQQIIDQPSFANARWGILVETLAAQSSQRQILVERDRAKLFIPASNAKLLTTAAALIALGPEYRIRTSIFGSMGDRGIGLIGDRGIGSKGERPLAPTGISGENLQFLGSGDPSLIDRSLTQLAQQLKQRGITQIAQLTLDPRRFPAAPNPDWTWGDLQTDYGAIAHPFTLNRNTHSLTAAPQRLGQPLKLVWSNQAAIAGLTIDNQTQTVTASSDEFLTATRDLDTNMLQVRGQLRVGGSADTIDLAVLNPTQVFRDRLTAALQAEKIGVNAINLATSSTPNFTQEVAFVESPPIAALIQQTNQESDNLYAEALLQMIGTNAPPRLRPKSTAVDTPTTTGLKTLIQTLETIGVDRSGYALVDGSGLARLNLASPNAIVQTLQGMAAHPTGQVFQASLPIAGRSGTLARRFRDSTAAGIVQAKTGTLTGVASLSGYLQPPGYRPIVFSLLLNQSTVSSQEQRTAIDAIVRLLTQLKSC